MITKCHSLAFHKPNFRTTSTRCFPRYNTKGTTPRTSNRTKISQEGDHADILSQFVLPLSKESTTEETEASTASTAVQVSPKVMSLYNNLGISPVTTPYLPQTLPTQPSPFSFHSSVNEDASYKKVPRLSITKLLTRNWCELRTMYDIYSGNPTIKPTRAMKLGSAHHEQLESEIHEVKEVTSLSQFIDKLMAERVDHAGWDEVRQGRDESSMAADWMEKIIHRTYALVTTSTAREMLVHGYVNLAQHDFLRDLKSFQECRDDDRVLISGIIDLIRLENWRHPKDTQDLFDEIEYCLKSDHHANGFIRIDWTRFIPQLQSIINKYVHDYRLVVGEIKTRSLNSVPAQDSVVRGAQMQVSYYKKLLDLLRGDSDLGYEMMMANARKRHLDLDQPLGLKYVLILLLTNHELIHTDFMNMARGQPIGIASFDNHSCGEVHSPTYSFQSILQSQQDIDNLEALLKQQTWWDDSIELTNVLAPQFFQPWRRAPTLRYFAARSASVYAILQAFQADDLKLEYHNGRTGRRFAQYDFKYDDTQLTQELLNATQFWNGEKPQPQAVDDLGKCQYCDFRKWCGVPNRHVAGRVDDKSIGRTIRDFLS